MMKNKKIRFSNLNMSMLLLVAFIAVFSYFALVELKYIVINVALAVLFVVIVNFKVSKEINKINKQMMLFDFVENFILSLSIFKTVLATKEDVYKLAHFQIKKELDLIKHLDVIEQLQYLRQLFDNRLYDVFLNTIIFYNEQGGDILSISELLLKEVQRRRANIITKEKYAKTNLFTLMSNWSFVFLIVLALRFAISSFYMEFLNDFTFVIGLHLFILMFYYSLYNFVVVKYKAKKTAKNTISASDFSESFTYFRIILETNTNVYTALKSTKAYLNGKIHDQFNQLVNEIEYDDTIRPFVKFSINFKSPILRHICIMIYQFAVTGGNNKLFYEFNYLFNEMASSTQLEEREMFKKSFEKTNLIPLLATGLIMLIMMLSVLKIIGGVLNV